MTILKVLWQLKWVFLVLGLVFSVWRWHVNDRQAYADAAVKVAVDKVKADWAAETAQEDADAIAAKQEWDTKVAARDAEIETLKAKQATSEAEYQTKLASARKAAADITRGVTASVRANPHDPSVCSLSDDTYRLLNEQIDQTNATILGETTGYAACRLQGVLQDSGCPSFEVADESLRRAFGSLQFPAYAIR